MDINQLQKEIDLYLDKNIEVIINSASEEIITFPANLSEASVEKTLKLLNDNKDNLKASVEKTLKLLNDNKDNLKAI
ncbi:MAG: hypothetical protein GX321_10120, partial [Clostridiales bacterium]|nr:hypothetical protein [Clostridiales bacterium]